MAYERINWQNGEVGNTPLNANNLNRMDMAIEEHDQKIGDHDYEIENLKTGAQGITEEINKKMDRINPQGSGTLSIPAVNADNITAQIVEADEIKVAKVGSKGGTAPVVFDNDILVNGITTPIGSLASSASAKAESAERTANEADREAGTARTIASTAYSRVQENIFRTDKLEGIVGGGVGESIPQYTYYDGKYLRPDGEIANYNDSARVIEFEINKNSDSGCNVIFKNVDLIPTEFSILCGFYNAAGILLAEEMRGLIVTTDFDEDTGKMTRQYISSCVVPAPYYAKYVRISGIANGVVDIAIQNTLSDAVAELQSRSSSSLVLTNPSPLPATDGKKILGIDAKGKSEQKTTQTLATVSGALANYQGYPINQNVTAQSNRCISDVIWLGSGTTFTVSSGFELFICYANAEDGNINSVESWGAIKTSKDAYCRIVVRKTDGSNITPSSFTLTATSIPTPTSPIPIVDASGEVVAIGKNLFDKDNAQELKFGIGTVSSSGTGILVAIPSNEKRFLLAIPCKPNTTYTISKDVSNYCACGFTDVFPANNVPYYNMNSNRNTYNATVTSSATSKFLIIYPGLNAQYESGITYEMIVNALMVEEGATVSPYEPYRSNSVSLLFDPESVGSVANEFIVNEDGSGKIVQRVHSKEFNGTENWTTRTTSSGWKLFELENAMPNSSMAHDSNSALVMSNQYSAKVTLDMNNTIRVLGGGKIGLRDDSVADLATFKSRMASNNLVVYCDLATPIEKTLTADEVAAVRQLMTYKGTTTIESEMDVVSVTYSGDIKAYIDYRIDQIINPTALNEVAPMNLDETEE